MDALASLGLLGLIVPKELGGLGQNHVCVAMVVETIARYGCPSTAMVYGEHCAFNRRARLRNLCLLRIDIILRSILITNN